MAMQTYALTPGRIEKFKGQILAHAVPKEVLCRAGRQVKMPANNSRTYVARRFVPYGATTTDANTQNRFFQNGTGDRGNAIVQAHQTQEGITPAPDSMTPQDVTELIYEYGFLYGFSNQVYELYEDDIPQEMIRQAGERLTFVNEMIVWGKLRQCTNVFYGGTGTSLSTVNGALTLGLVRKIVKGLQANHGVMTSRMLSASANYGTDAVGEGYFVYCHTDLEPDIRDLPNFTPVEKYASGKPVPGEVGKCERFRFVTSPDLPAVQDGGASVASTASAYISTSASNIDVYQILVLAENAFSQISVRGVNGLDARFISPNEISKSDPLGQRGYVGTIWKKGVMIENHGWMAQGLVAAKVLT